MLAEEKKARLPKPQRDRLPLVFGPTEHQMLVLRVVLDCNGGEEDVPKGSSEATQDQSDKKGY